MGIILVAILAWPPIWLVLHVTEVSLRAVRKARARKAAQDPPDGEVVD